MAKLIMISAKQGGGKTSLATALFNELVDRNKTVFLYRFAEPLYQLHDVVLEKARELGLPIPRDPDGALLQLLGTDWGRNTIDVEMWVKHALMVCIRNSGKDYIIIDDLRMKNEFHFADYSTDFEDILRVRLECPEDIRKVRRGPKWRPNTQHQSEIDLDDYIGNFDLVLHTNDMNVGECTHGVLNRIF